uniref:Uncharacterized protein n=1 Tax=Arundo donax TaxID=35708 RepID=A0A0A9C634_ARUDO
MGSCANIYNHNARCKFGQPNLLIALLWTLSWAEPTSATGARSAPVQRPQCRQQNLRDKLVSFGC